MKTRETNITTCLFDSSLFMDQPTEQPVLPKSQDVQLVRTTVQDDQPIGATDQDDQQIDATVPVAQPVVQPVVATVQVAQLVGSAVQVAQPVVAAVQDSREQADREYRFALACIYADMINSDPRRVRDIVVSPEGFMLGSSRRRW